MALLVEGWSTIKKLTFSVIVFSYWLSVIGRIIKPFTLIDWFLKSYIGSTGLKRLSSYPIFLNASWINTSTTLPSSTKNLLTRKLFIMEEMAMGSLPLSSKMSTSFVKKLICQLLSDCHNAPQVGHSLVLWCNPIPRCSQNNVYYPWDLSFPYYSGFTWMGIIFSSLWLPHTDIFFKISFYDQKLILIF